MMEEWQQIKYRNDYEVSNTGNIRRVLRSKWKNKVEREYRYINGIINSKGYKQIMIRNIDDIHSGKQHFIHRLVLEHFSVNIDNKPQINHINGIKTDNRLENLEWCTSKENCTHRELSGLSNNKRNEYGRFTNVERRGDKRTLRIR